MNVHIKQKAINNIDLNNVKYLGDKNYGVISTIDKNAESGFFLLNVQVIVYLFQYLNNIGKYVIKAN